MTPTVCPQCGGPLQLVTDGHVGQRRPYGNSDAAGPAIVWREVITLAWFVACGACEYCETTADARLHMNIGRVDTVEGGR